MKRKRPAERQGLRGVRYFVLDEADRLLDMGFLPQIREIVSLLGPKDGRQNLLFSATWPSAVHDLAGEMLRPSPVKIAVDQRGEELSANSSITQEVEVVRESRKQQRLLEILEAHEEKTLIFVNTKKGAASLADFLRRQGVVPCGEIHGNLSQQERATALADFTKGECRTLVATDVAARGIDVKDISLVVCFDFPDSMVGGMEDYVHRIGRTGRAGRQGRAVTFFPAPADVSGTRSAGNAHDLIQLLRSAGQKVPKDLAQLDTGPVTSSVQARAKGKKGSGKAKGKAKGSEVSSKLERQDVEIEPIARFQELSLSKALKRKLKAAGFHTPMPIQAKGLPTVLAGHDCIAIAKTGSGKTLAFLLPAMQHIDAWRDATGAGPLALVLAPTRELAQQIHAEAQRLCPDGQRAGLVYGGTPWEPQAAVLEDGLELLVATPGRLAFLMARGGERAATTAREIAAYGARKQLSEASAAFRSFLATGGTVTRHIFSSLMNAHVMCGDLPGAIEVSKQMVDAHLALGVVEYTTLLKGHLAVGDLAAAERLWGEMQLAGVALDVRSFNTLLRGAVKLGALHKAEEFYGKAKEWGIWPDAATYKLMAQVYSQRLKLKPLMALLKEVENTEAMAELENAAQLNLAVAQTAVLLGKFKVSQRFLQQCEEHLQQETGSADFDRLRRLELRGEVKRLKKALKHRDLDVVAALHRSLALKGTVDQEQLFEALQNGFGLDCWDSESFRAQLRRSVGQRLRWPRLFGRKAPVKLEVCSGTGDWVVAQAAGDLESNWVASELRFDRAWSIITKGIFEQLTNLAVLAGDAAALFRCLIPASSVSTVCINFPEPPQTSRNARCDDPDSQLHLLTPDFFQDAHGALTSGGVLTIFSDNEEYMRSLARTLGTLRSGDQRLYEPLADVPAEHLETAEEMNGLLICKGSPGEDAGHVVQATSQFDRFFQHGKHVDRFYLAVCKVDIC